MKLDLTRMLSSIATNNGGPKMGKPAPSQINVGIRKFAKKLVDKKMAEDEEDGEEEDEVVSEKKLRPSAVEDMMITKKGIAPKITQTQMSYSEGERVVPESGMELKKLLVKEGIFSVDPKSGDFIMTEKGMEMKKKGLLKKYKIS